MKCSEWENSRPKKQVSGFPELGCSDKKIGGGGGQGLSNVLELGSFVLMAIF